MIKFDSKGNLLWDKMIGDETWPYVGHQNLVLEVGANGLAYVGFTKCGNYSLEVGVSSFVVRTYDTGSGLR